MRRMIEVAALGTLLALVGPPLHAQTSLGSRVAQLPDGPAHLQYDARAGVCGDGRDVIGYRDALFARSFQSYGRWSGVRCVPGPVRVTLSMLRGQVTHLDTQVGGEWPKSDARATDLGAVPAPEASAFFFDLVPRLAAGVDRDRPLLPAVLADDPTVTTRLASLAQDSGQADRTRRDAILWLGLIGEDWTYLRALYSRVEGASLKEAVIQAAAGDDADRGRWLLQRARDTGEGSRLRRSALFWAGQHEATPTADLVSFLRDERDPALREHAIFVLSQRSDDAATDSLLHIARDDRDRRVRSRALFWLAQKRDPRVTKLITDILDR